MNINHQTMIYILLIIIILYVIYYSVQHRKKLIENPLFSPIKKYFNEKEDNDDDKGAIEEIEEENEDEKKRLQNKNIVEEEESLYSPDGPNLIRENKTQFEWKRLLHALNQINNRKKIKLKGMTNHQSYTQSTTRDRLRLDLDQITQKIIPLLDSENTYHYAPTNYGDVEVWTDKHDNEEIKYELFLWDKKHYFEIKLWVHVLKFVDKKYLGSYGVKKSPYLFPTYFIGYDVQDQIIPPPGESIPTMNASNYPKGMFSEKEPLPIQYLYVNSVKIQNSTLVVNYHKDMYPYPMLKVGEGEGTMGGTSDQSLYFSRIKGDKQPIYPNAKNYNKWISLPDEPTWKGEYPCKAPPINKWNEEGVYYYEKGQGAIPKNVDPKFCPGTRWSSMEEPLEPNYWPSNYTVDNLCGENSWLFIYQNPSNNTFYGGGKR